MNKIVNKFLLLGDKFMPEMHLKQLGFTYSACGPFTKDKEIVKKFKERGDTNYIYKNELDKVYLQHDMAYRDFKDLTKRTTADNVLRDKAFKIASDQKYDGYQRRLASMVYKFFDKKSSGSGVNEIKQNIQLADEHHKPIIKKFKKKNKNHSKNISTLRNLAFSSGHKSELRGQSECQIYASNILYSSYINNIGYFRY